MRPELIVALMPYRLAKLVYSYSARTNTFGSTRKSRPAPADQPQIRAFFLDSVLVNANGTQFGAEAVPHVVGSGGLDGFSMPVTVAERMTSAKPKATPKAT